MQTTGRTGTRLLLTGNLGFGSSGNTAGKGKGAGKGGPGKGGGSTGGVGLRVQVDDTAADTTTFDVQASAGAAIPLDGIYYWFNLAGANFAAGSAELAPADNAATSKVSLAGLPAGSTHYADATVKSIRIIGKGNRAVEFSFATPTHIVLQESRGGGRGPGGGAGKGGGGTTYNLLIPIGTGTLNPGTPFHCAFTLKATCDLDATPVKLAVDPQQSGPAFIGIGGNFRLQSPADAAVIAYNLDNLRVAFARLEMPLASWQTTETADPAAGQPADNVRKAMEMGRTLAQKKIPMIISNWSVPRWAAAEGGGARGTIAPEKWPAMYKGITSYIAFMKKNYGAEPVLFSFNEADMGINVKLTPEDQDKVIKGLGASFAAAGLATKMLLGDTGNPTPRPANYIEPSIADPEAMKFVGAVSYHCWTGGSDQIHRPLGPGRPAFQAPAVCGRGRHGPGQLPLPLPLPRALVRPGRNQPLRALPGDFAAEFHLALAAHRRLFDPGWRPQRAALASDAAILQSQATQPDPAGSAFAGHHRRASASHGRRLWRRRARLGDPPREHRHDPRRHAHGPAGIADDALPDRYRRRAQHAGISPGSRVGRHGPVHARLPEFRDADQRQAMTAFRPLGRNR